MSPAPYRDPRVAPSTEPAEPVGRLCGAAPGLERLIQRARYLESVDKALQQLLGSSLAGHCRVANINHDTLVLQTTSAAWGTRLRYLAPTLLQQLSRQLGWDRVKHAKVQVRPEAFPEREQPVRRRAQLSRESAALLRDVAENTGDPALKAALLRLSRRGL